MLLARVKEVEYLTAQGASERARKAEEFLAFVSELPQIERDQALRVSSHDLSTAWWDVAFYRKGSPAKYPQQLSDQNLRALLFDRDRALNAKSMKVSYGLATTREVVSERIGRVFAWFGRQTDRLPSFPRFPKLPQKIMRPMSAVGDRAGSVLPMLQTRVSVSNAQRTRSLTKYAVLSVADLAKGVGAFAGDFFTPFPLRAVIPEKWFTKTGPIFVALEKNADRALSDSERKLLEEYGALEKYYARQKLLKENPKWFKGLHVAKTTRRWAIAGVTVLAVGAAVLQSAWGDGTVDVETLLNDPKYALGDHQVQLINETLPFPHLAIRIGDEVFSYGVDRMTMTRASEYLSVQIGKEEAGVGAFLKRQRSVQVITLDLDDERVLRLRRHLALHTQKRYENVTLMNDCSTMVARALQSEASVKIPKMIDPSPSSVILYFAGERLAGNPVVNSARLVTATKGQNPWLHVLRNAWVNIQEAKFYFAPMTIAPFQVGRAVMDANLDQRPVQYHSKEQLQAYERYRDDAEKTIVEDPEIALYLEHADRIRKNPRQKEVVGEYFQQIYERELAQLESRNADFYDLVSSFYRLQYLSEAEKEIRGATSFNLSEALGDSKFEKELRAVVGTIDEAIGEKTPETQRDQR
jgi:hypothetical protein